MMRHFVILFTGTHFGDLADVRIKRVPTTWKKRQDLHLHVGQHKTVKRTAH